MLILRTFGGLSLSGPDGRPAAGAGAQRSRLAVLAVLAVAGDRGVSRDVLLALFWPESDDDRARGALKQALYAIRRDLGELTLGTSELRLNPALVTSDVTDFEAALDAGSLEDAVRLYAGPFLDGVHLRRAPGFDPWQERERQRLDRAYRMALETLARRAAETGDAAAACRWWGDLAAADPLSGRVALQVMDALVAAGDRESAIRSGEAHAARVRAELEIEPDPDIASRLAELRTSTAAAPRAGRPGVRPADDAGAPASTGRFVPTGEAAHAGRRSPRPWLVAVVLCIVSAAVWALRNAIGPSAATADLTATADSGVVVFPFTVEGDADGAYLGGAMVELLSNALDGSERLRGTDARAVHLLVAREGRPEGAAAGAQLSQRLSGELFVLGSIVSAGGNLRVSGTLYGRGPPVEALASATVAGSARDPFTVVEHLAAQLLAGRWPSVRRPLTEAAALTVRLPALQAFLNAEDAVIASDPQRAVAEYTRAIDEDSTFALAYLRLAQFARYNNSMMRADTLLEKAHRHSASLPGRYRSFLGAVQAADANTSDAEVLLREHVRRYPDDADGWFELGDWLLHANPPRGQPIADAERALDRALALDSTAHLALAHQVELKMLAGKREEASRIVRKMPGRTRHHVTLEIAQRLESGDPAALQGVVELLTPLDPNLRRLALIYLTSLTDHGLAGEFLWRWQRAQPQDARAPVNQRAQQTWIAIMNGDVDQASAELDSLVRETGTSRINVPVLAASLPWLPVDTAQIQDTRRRYASWDPAEEFGSPAGLHAQRKAREFLLALMSHRLGDPAAVARHLAMLADTASDSLAVDLGRELARSFLAWQAALRGDLDTARDGLAGLRIGPLRGGAVDAQYLQRYMMAETLARIGRDEDAARWYRSLTEEYTASRMIVFRVPALLGQARALERLGRAAEARVLFSRADTLWKQADPRLRSLLTIR